MKHGFVALLVGTLFGLGLTVSGMTQPEKVIAFLDIFGDWDPSLAFVMFGAISVHFVAYRFQKHQTSPLLADSFFLPSVIYHFILTRNSYIPLTKNFHDLLPRRRMPPHPTLRCGGKLA